MTYQAPLIYCHHCGSSSHSTSDHERERNEALLYAASPWGDTSQIASITGEECDWESLVETEPEVWEWERRDWEAAGGEGDGLHRNTGDGTRGGGRDGAMTIKEIDFVRRVLARYSVMGGRCQDCGEFLDSKEIKQGVYYTHTSECRVRRALEILRDERECRQKRRKR